MFATDFVTCVYGLSKYEIVCVSERNKISVHIQILPCIAFLSILLVLSKLTQHTKISIGQAVFDL